MDSNLGEMSEKSPPFPDSYWGPPQGGRYI